MSSSTYWRWTFLLAVFLLLSGGCLAEERGDIAATSHINAKSELVGDSNTAQRHQIVHAASAEIQNPNTVVEIQSEKADERADQQLPGGETGSRPMNILVTGGAGFIGSHTVVELLLAGHTVTVIDDCSNTAPPDSPGSLPPSLQRVSQIVGPLASSRLFFFLGSVTNEEDLNYVFGDGKDAVIHFAGLKAVGESKEKPLSYYKVNQGGTVALLEAMERVSCNKIIFSSSATVYQPATTLKDLPLSEQSPTGKTTNPYARSKLHVEEILSDASIANPSLSVVNLRYFNPVGAHSSGLIGEDPRGIPNNLMPYISQVAVGRRSHLNVFGNDYPTSDGTGMRDYIHVVDLAQGHLAAMKRFERPGFEVYNLGTGHGTSVLQLVQAFKEASGQEVPTVIADRRPGDVAWLWCSPEKARVELNWVASRNITDMCRDMWKFQAMNPTGYAKAVNLLNDPASDSNLSSSESSSLFRSVSEEMSETESETSDKKSDSGLSSEGSDTENVSREAPRKSSGFLHFLKKTSLPGPTHSAGPRDL